MKEFTKATARLVSQKVLEALKLLEKELGVKFKRGSGSFSSFEFGFKVIASIESSEADEDRLANESNKAKILGLPGGIMGFSFNQMGKTYKVHRIDLKESKYPVICSCDDGKNYKFPVRLIQTEYDLSKKGSTDESK